MAVGSFVEKSTIPVPPLMLTVTVEARKAEGPLHRETCGSATK